MSNNGIIHLKTETDFINFIENPFVVNIVELNKNGYVTPIKNKHSFDCILIGLFKRPDNPIALFSLMKKITQDEFNIAISGIPLFTNFTKSIFIYDFLLRSDDDVIIHCLVIRSIILHNLGRNAFLGNPFVGALSPCIFVMLSKFLKINIRFFRVSIAQPFPSYDILKKSCDQQIIKCEKINNMTGMCSCQKFPLCGMIASKTFKIEKSVSSDISGYPFLDLCEVSGGYNPHVGRIKIDS